MKIAQRILAQARAEVLALEEANARLHNPPTLFNAGVTPRTAEALGVNISDGATYRDLAGIRLLKPVTAHGGEPIPARITSEQRSTINRLMRDIRKAGVTGDAAELAYATLNLEAFEDNRQAEEDAQNPDPRWQANREVRFAVKAYSSFADDVSTEMTGLPAEPVTESTLEEWDPHVISWSKCFKRFHATMWAYLTATKITTRTVKVFTILVDRANCGVIVQRNNRFSPTGRKTVWREGVGDLKSAVERARLFEAKARERGDNVKLITFPGRERKLIILDGTKVIYRPDQKGAPEHGRKSYTTRKEAGEAVQNIYAWAQAQGFAVRVWNKPVPTNA